MDNDEHTIVICAGVYSHHLGQPSTIAEVVRLAGPGGLIVIAGAPGARSGWRRRSTNRPAPTHAERLWSDQPAGPGRREPS